jgi:hypothetical protein
MSGGLLARHQDLMARYYTGQSRSEGGASDIEILARHYRFVDDREDGQAETWEARMARRYHDKVSACLRSLSVLKMPPRRQDVIQPEVLTLPRSCSRSMCSRT